MSARWTDAFAALHDKVSSLHPSDRFVEIQMSAAALREIARETNHVRRVPLSEAESADVKELRMYDFTIVRRAAND